LGGAPADRDDPYPIEWAPLGVFLDRWPVRPDQSIKSGSAGDPARLGVPGAFGLWRGMFGPVLLGRGVAEDLYLPEANIDGRSEP